MNGWRLRLLYGAVMWVIFDIHANVTVSLPNTPAGMLAFHFSAALADFVLLYSTPWLLSGRLCDDMQTLSFVSIVGNALGWALYLAYSPPVFFNTFMWGLTCVQGARLLIVDCDDVDSMGMHLVRRSHHVGA